MDEPKITLDDVNTLWPHALEYLVDLLNGDYGIFAAREDIRSLIGSSHDPRTKTPPIKER